MKKASEIVVLLVLLVALLYGCNYALDNDPTFQGSRTYTGHGK